MKVGFIGVGQMGAHMAGQILAAGHDLVVSDVDRAAAASLLGRGATWAESPAGVAEACRVVATCLPAPQVVEEVALGANGLREGWKPGDLYVDMSTNSPSLIRRIAEEAKVLGVDMLDSPVSGGTKGAEAGTLTLMVGGRLRCSSGPGRSWSPWRGRSSMWARSGAETWRSWSTT